MSQETPTFKLLRVNPRRHQRGAEATELLVTWPNGDEETLWMFLRDIKANIKLHGPCDALRDAADAYALLKKGTK